MWPRAEPGVRDSWPLTRSRWRVTLRCAGALAFGFAAGISLVACQQGKEEPRLAALKKEAIASFVPSQGKLDIHIETEEHTALGKPIAAKIVRIFLYDDPGAAARGRDAAVEAASSSGWRMNRNRQFPRDPVFGAKMVETGGAMLSIGDYEGERAFKVSIRLEHTACPAQLCGKS